VDSPESKTSLEVSKSKTKQSRPTQAAFFYFYINTLINANKKYKAIARAFRF
jgi:hypothetical protein